MKLVFLLFIAYFSITGFATNLCPDFLIDTYQPALTRKVYMNEHRDLFMYAQDFDPGFAQRLLALRKGHVWLDVGGGQLLAQENYLGDEAFSYFDHYEDKRFYLELPPREERATPVAIAINPPKEGFSPIVKGLIEHKKILYYPGVSLHAYAAANPNSVDFLTDKKASAIYSHFQQAILDILKVLKINAIADIDTQYITILNSQGKRIEVSDYLRMGRGFKILSRDQWSKFFIAIQKTSHDFFLPELEIIDSKFTDDGPVTTYRIK